MSVKMNRYHETSLIGSIFGMDEEEPGLQNAHPVGRRVEEISSWVGEFYQRNTAAAEEDLVVDSIKIFGGESPEAYKERIERKREDGDWDEDCPYIESASDVSWVFPYSSDGMHVSSLKQGLWMVELSSGEKVVVSHSPLNLDGDSNLATLVCLASTEEGLETYNEVTSGIQTGPELEKDVYSASVQVTGLQLTSDVDIQETPAIHPKSESFFESVENFFEDPSLYTQFNQPGIKSWLVFGTYGTGKTTMIAELARRQKGETAVVFVDDEKELKAVARLAADQNIPTVIVVSEAEMVLNDSSGQAPSQEAGTVGASSEMLNFLDGVDQPRNSAGTALIMTTNRPKRISDRILKRTGRINERIQVGPLEGDWAAKCARFYLPENSNVSKETLLEEVGGRVGDDIRAVARDRCPSVATEMGKDTIDDEVFSEAAQQMRQDMQEIEEFDGLEDDSHDYGDENSFIDPTGK